jgi:molybdopterin synthase catalytic subunit
VGDAVAEGAGTSWVGLCDERLPVAEVTEWVRDGSCGATVVFTGSVRDHSEERPGVEELRYEAYEEFVEPRISAVVRSARQRWPEIVRVGILHRIGSLGVGDDAVVVAVSSPHRQEAFASAAFIIDEVKRTVPVWKYERWAGGEGWSTCHDHGAGILEGG